ncbi:MAG: PepSY domain-containing protein [Cyanobacteriota bacterium]|nr:PepSY domain-containing protein [Cyanobacteriota bacterium]
MTKNLIRKLHRTLAPVVLLPLIVTVFTGVSYRLGKSWFGLSRDQVHWLMIVHEGEYLGPTLEPIYVLLNGLGLLWMLATGSAMVWQNLSRSGWFRQWGSLQPETSEKPEEPS